MNEWINVSLVYLDIGRPRQGLLFLSSHSYSLQLLLSWLLLVVSSLQFLHSFGPIYSNRWLLFSQFLMLATLNWLPLPSMDNFLCAFSLTQTTSVYYFHWACRILSLSILVVGCDFWTWIVGVLLFSLNFSLPFHVVHFQGFAYFVVVVFFIHDDRLFAFVRFQYYYVLIFL